MDKLVVIGTSAGGVEALKRVLSALPADFPAAVLVVMHIGARESALPSLLRKYCALQVRHARDGELLAQPVVLVAPPDRHLIVVRDGPVGRLHLTAGPMENYTRPAVDPLFRSAAAAFRRGVTGVILTGYLDDGTAGLQAVKACGGTAIVQDPAEAFAPGMPASALENVAVDYNLKLDDIGPELARLASMPLPPDRKEAAMSPKPPLAIAPDAPPATPDWIRIENLYASGKGTLRDLEQVAVPTTFTCPECSGTLWKLRDASPARFRCHTGHSFTAQALDETQDRAVEEAMWSAIRALNEKEELARRLAGEAGTRRLSRAEGDYLERADAARHAATVLRGLLLHDQV
ncbi:chemotaxis protein CheB [Pseudoduganella sp. LjRoot289]|uniref:chemotaxis protein CheB n=1 Tax=Pseudoduganella sp. LjRoot289 TaxID=3342314 RepID=UPI003ECCEF43